jgi:hypothetical protein
MDTEKIYVRSQARILAAQLLELRTALYSVLAHNTDAALSWSATNPDESDMAASIPVLTNATTFLDNNGPKLVKVAKRGG